MGINKQSSVMDVVYVYRKTFSSELDWSIKSLKNIPHDKVFVIGDDPESDVRHFYAEANSWYKRSIYHNQIDKYLTACNLDDISEDFIAMNDDVFFMQPQEVQIYNRGTMEKHIKERNINDLYGRSLKQTLSYLRSKGLPEVDYELHTPSIFNKTKLKKLIESLQLDNHIMYQIRSLYGNTYGVESVYSEDSKNPKDYIGRKILSTNERSFMGNIGNYIRTVLQ